MDIGTTYTQIVFAPFWGWGVALALILFALLSVLGYALAGGKAIAGRLLTAFGLCLVWLNLSYLEENRTPEKDVVALVIDDSASMQVSTRQSDAEAIAQQIRKKLEAFDNLEIIETKMATSPEGSEVLGALATTLSQTPDDRIAGSIVITDGRIHDVPDDLEQLARMGPIHSIIVGNEKARDLSVEIIDSAAFSFLGEEIELSIRAKDNKVDMAESEIRAWITLDGRKLERLSLKNGEIYKHKITLDKRGDNLIVVHIDGVEDEIDQQNNYDYANVSVVPHRLRILLVTGSPNNGGRVWRDLLKADPDVDLVHFTILKTPLKFDSTPTSQLALIAFPTRELFEERLDEFDLIVFDQYERIGVLYMAYFDNLVKYVEEGGALLTVAGTAFTGPASLHRTPLAAILPGRPIGDPPKQLSFRPQLSDKGKKHIVTSALQNPVSKAETWGHWHRYIPAARNSGDILMETETGDPLLIFDRVKEGRVALLLSDQIWLWARGFDGGGPYAELIRRMVQWLIKEPDLEEEQLSLSVEDGQIMARLRTLSDRPNQLRLSLAETELARPDWIKSAAGHFEAAHPAPAAGLVEGRAGDLFAMTLIAPNQSKEFETLLATDTILEPVSEATRGGLFWPMQKGDSAKLPDIRHIDDQPRMAGNDWMALENNRSYRVTASRNTALWPGILGAGFIMLFLILAWRKEGR